MALTFENKHLKRLKELYPKAKHFVYVALPDSKETSFTIEKGASLKKGIADHLTHLKKEHGYTDEDMKIESYDLRGIDG